MNANDNLKGYTGTGNYFKYICGIIHTDGVKALCEQFECWWFLDIVCSYQSELKQEEFQTWSLKVNEDDTAIVTCTDGNKNILRSQAISYTDFKAKEATVWCVNKVIMLPCEY